ncbi:MAG: sensor histidine kinase [Chloroflexota bacterium]|nr:sensor histidine kinase [Chloroflexota bacterium]
MNEQCRRRLVEVPLLYKILLANGMIVVLGATVGTLVTAHTVRSASDPLSYTLITVFAFVGFVLSIGVNYVVLRAAFQPLYRLGEVAEGIRQGDFSRRVRPSTFSDPMLARLGASFNETLDELEQDRDRLRELTSQILDAQEDERKRIARELHDDTAQVLFAQLLRLTALKSSEHEAVRASAEALEQSTVDAIEGVRRLALELRPPALDDLGLWAALGELAQRYEERYDLEVDYEWRGSRERLAKELELVLYRIAQEAMTNVVKHARASHAQLALSRSADEVALSITDDGVGFDVGRASSRDDRGLGLGIFGMVERSSLVGGSMRVIQLRPHGARIEARVPLALVERIMEPAASGGKTKG